MSLAPPRAVKYLTFVCLESEKKKETCKGAEFFAIVRPIPCLLSKSVVNCSIVLTRWSEDSFFLVFGDRLGDII